MWGSVSIFYYWRSSRRQRGHSSTRLPYISRLEFRWCCWLSLARDVRSYGLLFLLGCLVFAGGSGIDLWF